MTARVGLTVQADRITLGLLRRQLEVLAAAYGADDDTEIEALQIRPAKDQDGAGDPGGRVLQLAIVDADLGRPPAAAAAEEG